MTRHHQHPLLALALLLLALPCAAAAQERSATQSAPALAVTASGSKVHVSARGDNQQVRLEVLAGKETLYDSGFVSSGALDWDLRDPQQQQTLSDGKYAYAVTLKDAAGRETRQQGTLLVHGGEVIATQDSAPAPLANQIVDGDIVFTNPGFANYPRDIRLSDNQGGLRFYGTDSLTASPTGAAIQFFGNNHTLFPGQLFLDSGATGSGAINFRTTGGGGTITNRMRIDAQGRVRIGFDTGVNHNFNVGLFVNTRNSFPGGVRAEGIGYGVQGYASSDEPGSVGVEGQAYVGMLAVGVQYGVKTTVSNTGGYGGYFDGRGYFSHNVGLGLGAQQPVARLHVSTDTTNINDNTARFEALDIGPNISHIHYGTFGHWYIRSASSSGRVILQDTGGNVGVGTSSPGATFEVKVGGTTLADAWTTRSSARLKTNIQPLSSALDKLLRLRGVSFDYRETGKHSVGFIAEEVGKVLPEVVDYEENGVEARGLDYAKLTPVLVEAVREQQRTIEDLREQNKKLQAHSAAQDARLAALEAIIKSMQAAQPPTATAPR